MITANFYTRYNHHKDTSAQDLVYRSIISCALVFLWYNHFNLSADNVANKLSTIAAIPLGAKGIRYKNNYK